MAIEGSHLDRGEIELLLAELARACNAVRKALEDGPTLHDEAWILGHIESCRGSCNARVIRYYTERATKGAS